MTELRAQRNGLDIVVSFSDADDLAPDLRSAIDELVQAFADECAEHSEDEVTGFGLGLGAGSGFVPLPNPLAPSSGKYGPKEPLAGNCWGHFKGSDGGGDSCVWYDGKPGDVTSCGIFNI